LGIGLYLLAKGAQSYSAIDKYDLAASAPAGFYEHLFRRLARTDDISDAEGLRAALAAARSDPSGRLRYLVRPDFDIAAAIPERSIDIVLSNAAFEHVEDVERMMSQLSRVVKAGGMMVAEVDLRTHSRWIRDMDPNNIYRYNEWIYQRFHYAGRPNRVRPGRYRQSLQANGWTAIEVKPASQLASALSPRNAHLAEKFRGAENQMDYLTVTLCATKST
jgi:SAM-dependent methyltransferase